MMMASRLVRRQRLFVAAPLLSLSIVLAGLAMCIAWRLLASPVGVERPERVVVIRTLDAEGRTDTGSRSLFTARRYDELETMGAFAPFESAAAVGTQTLTVHAGPVLTRAPVHFVTPGFFDLLGRPVRRGRGFDASDFARGAAPVAILSDLFWRHELDGSGDILGGQIVIGDADVTVIGIAPPGVIGTNLQTVPAAFLPLPQVEIVVLNSVGLLPGADVRAPDGTPILVDRSWLDVLARVRGADALPTIEQRLRADRQLSFVPLREAVVPFTARVEIVGTTRLFLIASLAFLLLGATTFAMVALLHLESRRSEWAMRLVLGANRRQIAAAAGSDVLIVALLAVALALPVAALAMRGLSGILLPGGISVRSLGLTLDGAAIALLALAGLIAIAFIAIVIGLGVAAHTRTRARLGLRLAGAPALAPRLRSGVVAVLLSLAIALLGGAVFATRTVARTLAVELGGHRTDQVLYAQYDLREHGYTDTEAWQFVDALTARAVASPAVNKASVHFRFGGFSNLLHVDGEQQDYAGFFPFMTVGPSYLDTLGLRILAGRDFAADDRADRPPVAVVSASVARAIAERNGLADLRDVAGRTLLTPLGSQATIAGVVETWVYDPRDPTGRAIYLLADQLQAPPAMPTALMPTLVLDVADARAARQAVLAAGADLDARVVPVSLQTADESIRSAYVLQDLASRIMTLFGTVALVLAFISLHVLVRSIAAAKRKEIAIRTALGAQFSGIARWLLAEVARPVLVAIPCGALALWFWFSVMSTHIAGLAAGDLGPVLLILAIALSCAITGAIGPVAWASRHLSGLSLRDD